MSRAQSSIIYRSRGNLIYRHDRYEKELFSPGPSGTQTSDTIRKRREVIQHAVALQYIITEIVLKDKPLSEDIILRTHYILTEALDIPGGISWKQYAGKYRTTHVQAGSNSFVSPKIVPAKVRELVADFEADQKRIEVDRNVDPFILAAKYCNELATIHPFVNGNGRTCRLILNAILLKYAGIVVYLGENDEGRQKYLDIQIRAGEHMEGPGELAALVLRKALTRYRALKGKLTGMR